MSREGDDLIIFSIEGDFAIQIAKHFTEEGEIEYFQFEATRGFAPFGEQPGDAVIAGYEFDSELWSASATQSAFIPTLYSPPLTE